jgi:hypothetical protein
MSEKQRKKYFPEKDSYKIMVDSAKMYDEQDHKLRLGNFVYRDVVQGPLDKGTSRKKDICIISEIIKNRSVTRYELLNLRFEKLVGPFYAANLRNVPKDGRPTSDKFYSVDYIVKWGKVDGVSSALVKWVGLDDSYNRWVPQNMLTLDK